MSTLKLITEMYMRGLGELLVLHRTKTHVFLGNLTFEKGRFIVRDKDYLADIKPAQLNPCWDNGTVGMVCHSGGHEWESLTFYGLDHCNLPVDLSSTRHGKLAAAENQYGDRLNNFIGSIYRGYQLLLDNHFLPVILLTPIKTKAGEQGLTISDLRASPMSITRIQTITDAVRKSVEKYLIHDVEDVEVSDEKFQEMFKKYLPGDN
jgi:hypothetical protein